MGVSTQNSSIAFCCMANLPWNISLGEGGKVVARIYIGFTVVRG